MVAFIVTVIKSCLNLYAKGERAGIHRGRKGNVAKAILKNRVQYMQNVFDVHPKLYVVLSLSFSSVLKTCSKKADRSSLTLYHSSLERQLKIVCNFR
jgi:hypothetical protein